ncbi:hypothetical protein [Saccharopolyspora karakumensis]|nr:hypothetical protein [Saccharopolyspora karakumensis]
MTTSRHGVGVRTTIDWTMLSIGLVMLLVLGTVALSVFVVGA